jgi:hypothetical protein
MLAAIDCPSLILRNSHSPRGLYILRSSNYLVEWIAHGPDIGGFRDPMICASKRFGMQQNIRGNLFPPARAQLIHDTIFIAGHNLLKGSPASHTICPR